MNTKNKTSKGGSGTPSRIERFVIRRNNLEAKLIELRKGFADVTQSFYCSKCKNLETRIFKLDMKIKNS